MQLSYATTNQGKVKSLELALSPFSIPVVQAQIDLEEPRSDSVYRIARSKLLQAREVVQGPLVVLDAAFCIKALNDFPNTFIHHALSTIGVEGLLRLTEGKDRSCEFVHAIAYADQYMTAGAMFFFYTERGKVADVPRSGGSFKWSELWKIFIPEGSDKTLAEFTEDEIAKREQGFYKPFGEWLSARAKRYEL